ncbi:MAG: hypothetical protein ACP5RP_00435 [Candidatus Micrarchaeia archaeon]
MLEDKNIFLLMLFAIIISAFFSSTSFGSYTILNVNVNVTLFQNNTASVVQIYKILLTNGSIEQYYRNRLALNLTTNEWATFTNLPISPAIVNLKKGVNNLRLLPGPAIPTNTTNESIAYLELLYNIYNATSLKAVEPRRFEYAFNSSVLNFGTSAAGEILQKNYTFTIILPPNSHIISVYPVPDLPKNFIVNSSSEISSVSWNSGELLSKFQFVFVVQQTMQQEVMAFFGDLYKTLGIYLFVIVGIAILAVVLYAYFKIR